jgi:hypothetical protein
MKAVVSNGPLPARAVRAVDYPSTDAEWDMPEGTRHSRLCEIMYQLLRVVVGPGSTVGADQFVYFVAGEPKRKCAPDAFVKLGVPQAEFLSWKTWEDGTPELCVEILSASDTKEKLTLKQKLTRFRAMGTREVLVYDVDAAPGTRLRAWDHVDGDLRPRTVEGDSTPCRTLGLWFVIAPCADEGQVHALRLAEDSEGRSLVQTLAEQRGAKLDAVRHAAEVERKAAEVERQAKEAALARIAELEAKLARR